MTISHNRNGHILTRDTILKADYHPHSQKEPSKSSHQRRRILEPNLIGAPNFRATGKFKIFGVGQPSSTGCQTVSAFLKSFHTSESSILWINLREEPFLYINDSPYVIRDVEHPLQNIKAFSGVTASRLEAIEDRLAQDVKKEAQEANGLIQIHVEDESLNLIPSWLAVSSVKTPKEVFQSEMGIQYKRIPISSLQFAGNEEVLDELLDVVQKQPPQVPIVVSCGMGVGRVTFAMIACFMVRSIGEDLNVSAMESIGFNSNRGKTSSSGQERDIYADAFQPVQLFFGMPDILASLHEDSTLREKFLEAFQGNYASILDLSRTLENGLEAKNLLDSAVDACAGLMNLRENILMQRIAHAKSSEHHQFLAKSSSSINWAISSLERYFYLLTFCSFLLENSQSNSSESFSCWIRERKEIGYIFKRIRQHGPSLGAFFPIPLHLEKSSSIIESSLNEDEESLVLKHRCGTVLTSRMILKNDYYWNDEDEKYNYRSVGPIHGISQPPTSEIQQLLRNHCHSKVIWINLREEPIVYLDGIPHVLRDEHALYGNIKSFAGISASRIESMENRLKKDILHELKQYEGKLLIHSEAEDGTIISSWICIKSVQTPREAFESCGSEAKVECFSYHRIPITAEHSPECRSFDEIFQIVRENYSNQSQFFLNCQLGKGRSTMGMIAVKQSIDFLENSRDSPAIPIDDSFYKCTLSLIRLVSNGLEIKNRLDSLIEAFSQKVHISREIHQERKKAESGSPITKGILHLLRYSMAFAFEAWLDMRQISRIEVSFSMWMKSHPEIIKVIHEVEKHASIQTLIPQSLMPPGELMIGTTAEILQIINNRSGSVLAHRMILKHDHFLGCQKMSLSDRIEGVPNFRAVSLNAQSAGIICGVGMPKKQAIDLVLQRLEASQCPILWTSFREEPVLFVKGEPYVLRFFHEPLANIESTGITRERVEAIEERLKKDVLEEAQACGGRILLHEEQVGGSSLGFCIPWNWTSIQGENDVKTCKEIYQDAISCYPMLSYQRIPITDEQAPLPEVFDELYRLIHEKGLGCNLIYNCQMGRGRTTTGMVIASIIEIASSMSKNSVLFENHQFQSQANSNSADRLVAGEYRIIVQLVSILDKGIEAKRIADSAIDTCSHMQNLRTAIASEFITKLSQLPGESKQRMEMRERALNYLMRYFYLIVFADYCIYKNSGGKKLFSQWLALRKDILNLEKQRTEFVTEF